METLFKDLYLGEFKPDEEYEHYLRLWDSYRKQTDTLPYAESKEAFKIHKFLFGELPKNRKYQEAKITSLKQPYIRRTP